MIAVHLVIVQQVVHTEIAIPVQVPVRHQIAVSAVTVHAIRVQVHVHLPIAESVVTVHAIHVHLQIVHPVHTEIAQNVVTIVVQVLIVQQVVHMVTATHVRVHVHLQIVHVVARRVDRQIDAMIVVMDREIHDHQQTNLAEATHSVAIVQRQAMIDVHQQVVPQVAPTVHVTIVHHAMIVAAHVTANAVVVPIVPEVASPMIAKSVHAVALAKSA
jgi:hypothetical protein